MTINCKKHGIVGTLVLADGNAYCPYCGFNNLLKQIGENDVKA